MLRIASGTVDQFLYFNAGQVGLSAFTVYRSRNGASAVAMTTPTITELMLPTSPETRTGVYQLLLDEDMTIGASNVTEHMVFWITHAGLSPVLAEIELFDETAFGGSGVSAADIADAVWDEAQGDHVSAGSFGEVATEVASILVDTAEIGSAGAGLTAIPWNASWDAEVESEVNDALVAVHLDHLFAVDYDPSAKPGVATALLNEIVENDVGVSRFTANALEQAPAGGGGGDATEAKQDTIIALIGTPSGASVSADILAIDDLVDTEVAAIKSKTDSLTFTVAGKVDANTLLVEGEATGVIVGQAATGTLSTTQATTNLTGYANDQLIGRVIIWLTGVAEGEATDITDYASASGLLTFTALTVAPGNGDKFKVV